jgi:transcriptional regulator with XRE-family HTH domain
MSSFNLLGEFLRARRKITAPEQVGLPCSGSRRTTGLRREEVARLAGVSIDYYIRLEQGREHHPSDRVLDALMRALDLGPDAATHLYDLAHPGSRQRGTTSRTDQVNPDLIRLIHRWSHTPAMVINRWMNVLAINPPSAALHSELERVDNPLRLVFLDPAARRFYRDWEQVARHWAAHLRAVAGADLNHPELIELIGELSSKSTDFRQIWSRHEVFEMPRGIKRFHHREVGELDFSCEAFSITSAPGQRLFILHAEPGSPSEYALTQLGNLADLMS